MVNLAYLEHLLCHKNISLLINDLQCDIINNAQKLVESTEFAMASPLKNSFETSLKKEIIDTINRMANLIYHQATENEGIYKHMDDLLQ